jgi:hypothetical protein
MAIIFDKNNKTGTPNGKTNKGNRRVIFAVLVVVLLLTMACIGGDIEVNLSQTRRQRKRRIGVHRYDNNLYPRQNQRTSVKNRKVQKQYQEMLRRMNTRLLLRTLIANARWMGMCPKR